MITASATRGGLRESIRGLHEAMICLHEAMIGLREAMIGSPRGMIGLLQLIDGAAKGDSPSPTFSTTCGCSSSTLRTAAILRSKSPRPFL